MITIFALLCFGGALFFATRSKQEIYNYRFLFLGKIMLIVILAVDWGSSCLTFLSPKYESTSIEKASISSLNDTTVTNGNFILGSGKIKNDLYIYYMLDTEEGKQIQKVKNDESVFFQTCSAEEKPYMLIEKVEKDKRLSKYLLFYLPYYYLFNLVDKEQKVTFYVPENTITQEYNIDLS